MDTNNLIHDFLEFENNKEICSFHFKYDNILFWPLVRGFLVSKLLEKNENLKIDYKENKLSIIKLIFYFYSIIRYSPLRSLKQKNILIFGWHDGFTKERNGKWLNRTIDYFYFEYEKSTMVIEETLRKQVKFPRSCKNLRLHDWLKLKSSFIAKFNKRVSSEDQNTIAQFISWLKSNFTVDLSPNVYEQLTLYLYSLAPHLPNLHKYYKKIFFKIKPRLLIVECALYGKDCCIIKWAKDQGIVTGEIQHGHFSSNDYAYNYGRGITSNVHYSKFVPDYLLTYGEFANRNSFGSFKKLSIGYPHLFAIKKNYSEISNTNHSEKLILVILNRPALIIDLIKSFSKINENTGVSILVRPHPSYDFEINLDKEFLHCKNIIINSSNDAYDQIVQSDFIVGTVSSLLFEASFFSKPVLIFENEESRLMMPRDFGTWFKDAEELDGLVSNPSLIKSTSTYEYWTDNWKNRYHNFIESIM